MQLENAQRRATRLVSDLRVMCYEDRLRALNLPSILYRRIRMDMIQTFRIMTGIDDLEASDIHEFKRNQWPWKENYEATKQAVQFLS